MRRFLEDEVERLRWFEENFEPRFRSLSVGYKHLGCDFCQAEYDEPPVNGHYAGCHYTAHGGKR